MLPVSINQRCACFVLNSNNVRVLRACPQRKAVPYVNCADGYVRLVLRLH